MNKTYTTLVSIALCIACFTSAGAANKHKHMREIRELSSCTNIITETEDFTKTSVWSNVNADIVYNAETSGPFAGSWAQLWLADAVNEFHGVIYTPQTNAYLDDDYYVISVYAKKYEELSTAITLSLVSNVTYSTWWTVDGDFWELQEEGSTTSGYEVLPNGWYRFWIGVDLTDGSQVGEGYTVEVGITQPNNVFNGYGMYIYGANMTTGSTSLCSMMASGATNFQHRVVKRGYPNDFWYNHDFSSSASDGTFPDGFAVNDVDTLQSSAAMWYASDQYMDLSRAWGIIHDSTSGIVVVDTEFQINHPDLKDNIYTNQSESGGVTGVDDDGNGLIDDIHGWDTLRYTNNPSVWHPDDIQASITGVQHGSQMIGLMACVGNNEPMSPAMMNGRTSNFPGNVGILWSVPILPIKGVTNGQYMTNFEGSDISYASRLADWYNKEHGTNFRTVSESTIGGSGVRDAFDFNFNVVGGSGNTGTYGTDAWTNSTRQDSITVAGAVKKNKTAGNEPATASYITGSMTFGPNVDVCGYAGTWNSGSYYNSVTGKWVSQSGSASPMVFVPGFSIGGHTAESLKWQYNTDISAGEDEVFDVMMPSGGFTSGGTAQTAALYSMVHSMFPDLTIKQAIAKVQRGCVPDVYKYSTTGCNSGDCSGGWAPWSSGVAHILGDVVMGQTSTVVSDGKYYVCISAGTSSGTGLNLTGGSDTGCQWYEIPALKHSLDISNWVNSTAYTIGTYVKSAVDGKYYVCRTNGTSSGNANDLDGGSDSGCSWYLARAKGDWKTEGFMGAGRINAYRTITLWGTVADTTIAAGTTVYVSGDVHFTGFTTINSGVTFKIAPTDIYEDEITKLPRYGCQPKYVISGLTVTNPSPPTDKMVEIYISGIVNITGPVTFESNAQQVGPSDWGGVWKQTGSFIIGENNITSRNTVLGDYK